MSGLIVYKAKAVCERCDAVFHQLDFDEDHALDVVRASLARHIEDEHPVEPS